MRPGAIAVLLLCAGCRDQPHPVYARPGDPLPGLDSAQLQAFREGRALFDRDFTVDDGLGPLLNDERCASCHDIPAIGGMGGEIVRKVSRFENGRCDLLADQGGDLLQRQSIAALQRHGIDGEEVPERATAVAHIFGPPLYGLGLLEAVAADDLLEHADSADENRDGISGRAGQRSADGLIGRFGRKATFPTLRSFIAGALLGELGITSTETTGEERPNGRSLPPGADLVPDPEMSDAELDRLVEFVRLLALPEPETVSSAAVRDSIARGAGAFHRIGCSACHVRSLRSSGRTVDFYSDFLLHDLGEEDASICARGAGPSEWRTTSLVGLRYRHNFLHDGRASSLQRAIELHGGEAAASRDRFHRLSLEQQQQLLRFLRSL